MKHYDYPKSEKAHPLPWSEAPTFPLGPLFHTQRFSCCISISPPSFMTFVWIFLPPLTGKSSEPGLKSLRSLHARSQTAQKSLNMNYQAESARCHSEFFGGMSAVFTFVLNAFIPILFQLLAFPVALHVCSRLPLRSEDPSVSVWIKSCLASWLVAGGPSGCCYAYTGSISLRSGIPVWNEWWLQKHISSSGMLLSWAALLLRSREKKRTIWGRLQVACARDSYLDLASLDDWAFAFSIWIWMFEGNMKEVCKFYFPVFKSCISFPWQESSSEAQLAPLGQCLLRASLLEGAELPSLLLPWLLLWTGASAHPWPSSCAQPSRPLQCKALMSFHPWCQSRAQFSVGFMILLSTFNDSDAYENLTSWASGKA